MAHPTLMEAIHVSLRLRYEDDFEVNTHFSLTIWLTASIGPRFRNPFGQDIRDVAESLRIVVVATLQEHCVADLQSTV